MNKTTLVIGASLKPERYANMAIKKLVAHKQNVVAIGLREGVVAGVHISKTKHDFDNIDTVTLYIGARHQPEYYDYIVSLQPRRVIFNPGTGNPEFYQILLNHKIISEVSCTLVLLSTKQY